jgi:hypothetical protein
LIVDRRLPWRLNLPRTGDVKRLRTIRAFSGEPFMQTRIIDQPISDDIDSTFVIATIDYAAALYLR